MRVHQGLIGATGTSKNHTGIIICVAQAGALAEPGEYLEAWAYLLKEDGTIAEERLVSLVVTNFRG